jgi:hypothetical protein
VKKCLDATRIHVFLRNLSWSTSTVFWDVTPYRLIDVYIRFGGIYSGRFQDRKWG